MPELALCAAVTATALSTIAPRTVHPPFHKLLTFVSSLCKSAHARPPSPPSGLSGIWACRFTFLGVTTVQTGSAAVFAVLQYLLGRQLRRCDVAITLAQPKHGRAAPLHHSRAPPEAAAAPRRARRARLAPEGLAAGRVDADRARARHCRKSR